MKKTMRHEIVRGVFLLFCMALCLSVLPAVAATGNTWTGSGPFATGQGNRVINALAFSPGGLTIYAGTGSGTVFQNVIPAYTLDVTVQGAGTVNSSPSGIDCGGTCSATYEEDTVVELSALADTGSTFTGWSGDCSGSGSPLDVTMVAAKSCKATFTLNAVSAYAVTPAAGTGGTISPNTPQTVNYGDTASFTVTPDTGYSISSVTGCGGTLSGNTYTTGPITGACTVSVTFAQAKKGAVAVPAMNGWGMIFFMALAGLGSVVCLRRRKVKAQ